MVKVMRRILFTTVLVALATVMLSGCFSALNRYGFDREAWQSMTDTQRQKVVNHYKNLQHRVKQSRVEDENDRIEVNINGGWAMMPPFNDYKRYRPVNFELAYGECGMIQLYNKNGDESTPLMACYQDEGLYLDPTVNHEQEQPGTVHIPRSPLWQWGNDYREVTTGGIARLLKANVTIDASNHTSALPEPQMDAEDTK